MDGFGVSFGEVDEIVAIDNPFEEDDDGPILDFL